MCSIVKGQLDLLRQYRLKLAFCRILINLCLREPGARSPIKLDEFFVIIKSLKFHLKLTLCISGLDSLYGASGSWEISPYERGPRRRSTCHDWQIRDVVMVCFEFTLDDYCVG